MNIKPPQIEWITVSDRTGRSLKIKRFPVTVGEFRVFIEAGGYRDLGLWSEDGRAWLKASGAQAPSFWGEAAYCSDDQLPVTGVTFYEAMAFAKWAGSRLPTEAEWTWIASNCGQTEYPWGNQKPSKNHSQITSFLKRSRIAPVNAHPRGASNGGIQDLVGNVSEWCYRNGPAELPTGRKTAILKGGASWHTAENIGPLFRDVAEVTRRDNDTGIRLVKGPLLSIESSADKHGEGAPPILHESKTGLPYVRPVTAFRQEKLPKHSTIELWHLKIDGAVKQVGQFTIEGGGGNQSLRRQFKVIEDEGFLTCVCRWCAFVHVKGVRIADVVRSLGITISDKRLFLNFTSLPGPDGRCYETSCRLVDAENQNALLIFEMDGIPLTPRDGAPLRTINFHTFGYKHVKGLARITVSTAPEVGWWEKSKGYAFDGIIKPGTYTLVGDPARKLSVFSEGRIKPSLAILQSIHKSKRL